MGSSRRRRCRTWCGRVPKPPAPPAQARPTLGLDALLAKVEQRIIEAALARHHGNKAAVAEELAINRSHLYKRLRALGLGEQIRPSDDH
jgi:DNA-binding NtrC family response regulator